MTRIDPTKVLKQWGGSVVPVESTERVASRRGDVVPHIALAIRRGARSRRRRSRVIVGWFGLVAAVLFSGGLVLSTRLVARGSDERAVASSPVQVQAGEVEVFGLAGTGARAVHAGEGVGVGRRLVARSAAALSISGLTGLRLDRASELLIHKASSQEQLMRLSRGRIAVDVTPGRGMDVHIETPDAQVAVKGTQFTVAVTLEGGTPTTAVAVQRGLVEVHGADGRPRLLRAGERWSSHSARQREQKTEAMHRLAPPVDLVAEPPRKVARRRVMPEPAPAESKAQASDAGTLAEENSLFHQALRARNQGADARAVQLFTSLLSQYPRTALSQEAKVERFRALGRLGRTQQAAELARRYLAEHPGGFAQAEARELAWQGEPQRR